VAIIGLGQIGLLFDEEPKRQELGEIWTHVSAYLKLGHLYEIVAAVDTDPSKFSLIKKRIPKVKCFLSIEEMLASVEIDVVSVCTPDLYHLECLRALVGRVKGIFLEKPICSVHEIEDASSLMAELKELRTSIRVNYYKTHEPLFRKAMDYLADQDSSYVSVKYSGPFEAVGSHALNILVYLNSTLRCVKCFKFHHNEGDGVSAFFEFEGQGLAELIYCGTRHNLIFELDVFGKDRRILLEKNFSSLKLFEYRSSLRYEGFNEIELGGEETLVANANRFTLHLIALAKDIRTNCPDYSNWDEAFKTQQLMAQISKEG
ncbi:Gfo/Idh/MocA family oxidoreductase, partial [Amylibacter sp.]|nr:Gfo/Idh/MocA family oxidoreductase [Amylibacter sp.]